DPSAPLSRRTLQQMIDACGGGGGSALAHQEVAEWTVTTRPAQLSAAGGTVLWWGPETEAASPPVVWDQAESAALTAGGARLLERLRTAAGRAEEDRLTPESLVDDGLWRLAGRSLAVRTPAEEHPRPDTSASRTAGDLTHLLPSRVSYSQLDTLIACPHRWVL